MTSKLAPPYLQDRLQDELWSAINRFDLQGVEGCFKAGVDPNRASSVDDMTPLGEAMNAVMFPELVRYDGFHDPERAEEVLDIILRVANPNTPTGTLDYIPLRLAVTCGSEEVLKKLLKAKADPNMQLITCEGEYTPPALVYAARYPIDLDNYPGFFTEADLIKRRRMVGSLLRAGASPFLSYAGMKDSDIEDGVCKQMIQTARMTYAFSPIARSKERQTRRPAIQAEAPNFSI